MTATAPSTEPAQTLPEPADRGSLEIDRTVLRKITEHAIRNVPGCVPVRRTGSNLGLGDRGPSATLHGPDSELRIRLEVPLTYPAPIRETVHEVRERVTHELEELADCRVRTIDVTVWALVPEQKPPRVE